MFVIYLFIHTYINSFHLKIKNYILKLLAINIFKVKENYEITLLFKNNAFITLLSEVLEVTLEDQNKLND